jgi:hypothetical protein
VEDVTEQIGWADSQIFRAEHVETLCDDLDDKKRMSAMSFLLGDHLKMAPSTLFFHPEAGFFRAPFAQRFQYCRANPTR